MQNRTAKFASAIVASVLAGAPLATVSHSAAPAADECLSKPKGQAPEGSHWYYRVDHASKRHCWYLREQRDKLSWAKSQDSAAIADPASPQKGTATQRPVADARAELSLPQTLVEQETRVPWQRIPSATANAASSENGQSANAPDAKTQRSVIASRWPDPSGVSSSADQAPTPGNSGEPVQLNSEQAPPLAVASSAAADLSFEKQSGSVQMLLLVMMGALVIAGVMGSAIFRFGSGRWAGRQTPSDRRAIWDSVDTDRPPPPAYPRAEASLRRVDIPRELRQADDPNGRIAEMLTRLSKGAAT